MAEPIEMPFGEWTLVGPRNRVADAVQISPCEGAILSGKWLPIVKCGDSVVSCAEMAVPIEMQFGMLSRVVPGNSVLDGGATWQIRLNCPCVAAMQPCVKLL